ncbi:hypothetical protein [Mangrovibacterium diazotrophicum]|uniref:Uncharacterized protein n=1 Tax=Mangrovibacterium diazotrophicum TaxID=1261403 RepID=A0A419W6F5_9BACT|nr:hypothetical protein [Mangrovibacterium diazotrophicum]RKD91047.1 hypothetical protein BC643_1396 [Mangrovibacterium diazotrophicum]
MGYDALKLELIEWLSKLEDPETIEYLKIVKDSKNSNKDWWNDLSDSEKAGIARGLNDIQNEQTVAHEDVMKKYGL